MSSQPSEEITTAQQREEYEASLACPECGTKRPRVEWHAAERFGAPTQYVPGFATCRNQDCRTSW